MIDREKQRGDTAEAEYQTPTPHALLYMQIPSDMNAHHKRASNSHITRLGSIQSTMCMKVWARSKAVDRSHGSHCRRQRLSSYRRNGTCRS
eukprot:6214564-Pleurochrysis_carterae.AAC.6